MPKILVIAGSDSCGGAGIQADIKTITALGSHAMTAITAVTAQNEKKISGIHAVPPEFVALQIEAVLSKADIIKTGMLLNKDIINVVAAIQNIPIIVDPVMTATTGKTLLKKEAIETLKNKLFPNSLLVTPNIPEAEILSGHSIHSVNDMIIAGKIILQMCSAVLVKGGHLKGNNLVDILLTNNSVDKFEHKRINAKNTHGTGCTMASAIATYIANGNTLTDAVAKAQKYIAGLLRDATSCHPERSNSLRSEGSLSR